MSVKTSGFVSRCIRATFVLSSIAMLATAACASAVAAVSNSATSTASSQPTVPDPPAAKASSSSSTAQLQEVTVTGTRIRRPDLQAISPLVTITSAQLQQRAGINIESYLNQLPNYNPAQVPTTENQDVQPSAVNTVGISTISLRGLGPNRNLVLIDGHRTVPINALMETDINSIPQAMIQSIQTITGGASAVYGADAVSGVVNFILKKNFQGLQFNFQDSITQAGDGNQMDASALMGTNFADGKGNITMGLEYYNRRSAFQRNRSFFTNAWSDPNAPQGNGGQAFFVQGYNAWSPALDLPSTAALNAVFPARAAAGGQVCAVAGCVLNDLYFNHSGGSMWTPNGALSTSGYTGPTSGNGYGLVNTYNNTVANNALSAAPNEVQGLKWNNPLGMISEPQTRYSFWADGNYHLPHHIDFYTNVRFVTSRTRTMLTTPTTAIFGWEASIPFNPTTDSPINPADVTLSTGQTALNNIAAAFRTNPTNNPYINPNFIGPNGAGVQHPVPWQLAMLLLSRSITLSPTLKLPVGAIPGTFFGGPVACSPYIASKLCSKAPTSWILDYLPFSSAPQRSTVDQSTVWQIETGLRFLLFSDWTGELYYSRGQSANYEQGLGNDSLQRFRAVMDSPGYGAGQLFQGNANGASTNFGTSVPTSCTSGFYNTIFGGASASSDCMTAIAAPLQTQTQMQQDIVEANFQGSLFKLPTGTVSAALGFQYRREAGQFVPDNMQATYSFLDQTIGLYPLGTLNNEIAYRDGYAELYVPVLKRNKRFLQSIAFDLGGRYSVNSSKVPSATTFKVSMNAAITHSFRLRGGFNRAVRTPNLGELYLGTQEYFGGGAQYGDPCSVRSNASFGAGGAALDYSASGSPTGAATSLAAGQTAAGAKSTYLICQAQMSAAGAAYYYGNSTSTGHTNQGGAAASAAFAWLNEQGNANLRAETANTWTAGFVLDNLGTNPWIRGLSGSVDWWQIHIDNAIELDSPDYANYLCYGTATVTTAAQAAAQAASPACQNVGRNQVTGGETTALLQYTNSATIGIAGTDININWIAELGSLGLHGVPGAITFNEQASFLDYYRTKQSPTAFDVNVNWKDSLGPTLAGTNPGAYGYRLFTSFGYVLPSFSVNLRWRFLPSVNSANKAYQEAIIAHNKQVAATGKGLMLSYTPNRDIAAPSWSAVDLSASYTVNHWLQIRGGIDNLFDVNPAITGATAGFPVGKALDSYCSATAAKEGCKNPTAYSLPNDGAGATSPGFYDVYGRTFFMGFQATF